MSFTIQAKDVQMVTVPDDRIKEFNCPNCGAEVRYITNRESTVKCFRCHRKIVVSYMLVGHLLEEGE